MTDNPQPTETDDSPLLNSLQRQQLRPLSDDDIEALASITDADIAAAMVDARKNHPELYDYLTADRAE